MSDEPTYLFYITDDGITLGPTVYSHYHIDTDDIVLRNTRDDSIWLRLNPGACVFFGPSVVRFDTYDLSKTVLLPPEAIIPAIPPPYGFDDVVFKDRWSDLKDSEFNIHGYPTIPDLTK